jgi:hypothetical protein
MRKPRALEHPETPARVAAMKIHKRLIQVSKAKKKVGSNDGQRRIRIAAPANLVRHPRKAAITRVHQGTWVRAGLELPQVPVLRVLPRAVLQPAERAAALTEERGTAEQPRPVHRAQALAAALLRRKIPA